MLYIYMLFTGQEVRIGNNCVRGLENGPKPLAEVSTRDRGPSFSHLLFIWVINFAFTVIAFVRINCFFMRKLNNNTALLQKKKTIKTN